MMRYILPLILSITLFASCETEIEFNGKVTEPVLVANCIANMDSTLKVKITASRFFLSSEGEFKKIKNATLTLFVNGTFKETLTLDENGIYVSTYKAVEGDVLRINAKASGYEDVWAQETIPSKPKVLEISNRLISIDSSVVVNGGYYNGYQQVELDTIGMSYNRKFQYKVEFTDPSAQTNYYRLVAVFRIKYNGYDVTTKYLNEFNDVVFGTKDNTMDGIMTETATDYYNVFPDELIDGKTHTFTFSDKYSSTVYKDESNNSGVGIYDRSMTIELQSISKSYYLYLKALTALDNTDSFMSELVQVHTNVQNGLGLLGTKATYSKKIMLPD